MRTTIFTFLVFLSAQLHVSAHADAVRDQLFEEADQALSAANAAHANVLAPDSYKEASDLYRKAEDRLKKGQNLDRIRDDLSGAAGYLRKAVESTRLAEVTFAQAISARNDAERAESSQYASKEWSDAESEFAEAAIKLEKGNVKTARKSADEAEALFRKAELIAIKSNYLDETRLLISQAEKEKVSRYAPKTLDKAKSLLVEAETSLTENRYDIDQPRALAREAKYQAKHALHLASLVKASSSKNSSVEDLVLSMEDPVIRIASSLDLVAAMDGSAPDVSESIRNQIALLQKDSYELSESKKELFQMEKEISDLELRLGMQSERIATQDQRRKNFAAVGNLFSSSEAIVLQQGDNVLVRMVGLNFKTGKSVIETEYFSLLKKVQKAIDVFPGSEIIIEGHTDSFGSDAANLVLSQDRAEAVKSYLLANMGDISVNALGYGESRPIGNNETEEGRTKNRRIDLVIKTNKSIDNFGG